MKSPTGSAGIDPAAGSASPRRGSRLSVAVIGGGINGAGIAWELARRDYDVSLFERGEFGSGTSSASTKLIHGGLRYLEQGRLGLVRESLREREFLLGHLPALVRPLELILPLYAEDGRSMLRISAGLIAYDLLARSQFLPRHQRLTPVQVLDRIPIREEGLRGGFSFYDAQTDDRALVHAVIDSGRRDGVRLFERTPVASVAVSEGGVTLRLEDGDVRSFDLLINAVGPWMGEWLQRNSLPSRWRLSLVRGSHLIIERPASRSGLLLQSRVDRRLIFVLPWQGRTLIGTTEVLQRTMDGVVRPSSEEIEYLIRRYEEAFGSRLDQTEIQATFAGVRPLLSGGGDPTSLSRESRVEASGRVVNVFGGKLTTFLSLAREVGAVVDQLFGEKRVPRPLSFV